MKKKTATKNLTTKPPPVPYVPKQGRPTKLIPETVGELCRIYKSMGNITDSARCCGLDVSTVMHWQQKGRIDLGEGKTTIFSDFVQSLKNAEAEHKAELVAVIDKAARKGTWQAAAWRLERKWTKDYAPPVARVHVEGQLNDALDRVEQLDIPEEFKDRVLSAISGGVGGSETEREESSEATGAAGANTLAAGQTVLPTPPESETD